MTKSVRAATSREPEASSVPKPSLLVRLVRLLLIAAGVFAGVQFVLELVAWVNRAAAVSGKTDAEVRANIIGDIAPFLEHAAKQIPERDRVLLVTNESPWRARYLLLPRPVYAYHGSLPQPEDLEGKFLTEEQAGLHQLGISWVVYYTRTTTDPYRIIDSAVVPVAPLAATGAPPAGANSGAAEGRQARGSHLGRVPVVGTLVALVLTVVAGGAVLGFIEPRRGLFSYESLSLAYGLGTGCITIALFLLSWIGFPLAWCPPVMVVAGLVSFGVLVASRLRHRGAGGQAARRVSPEADARRPDLLTSGGEARGRNRWLSPLLVACLLLLFLSQGYYTSTIPLNAMDAMGFWGYSAKAVYYDGAVNTPAITDPLREHPHPRYPLLVPLAQVWVHLLQRGYEDKAVKLLFVGFYVALAGVVYGAAKSALSGWVARPISSGRAGARQPHAGARPASPAGAHASAPQAGLVAAVLVATLPVLRADGYGAAFALADIPLACYIASALLCWVRWVEGGGFRTLLLASLFGCFAAWTKNEGLAFFAILTVLTVVAAGAHKTRGLRPLPADAGGRRPWLRPAQAVSALATGWLLLVPWLLFRQSLPIADENYPAHLRLGVLWANLGRVPVVLLTWLREFADASQWSLLWLLAAVAAVWAVRELTRPGKAGRGTLAGQGPGANLQAGATALWLLAFGFSQLLVYTVVVAVGPWDVRELLSLTSTRLLLHVLPAAVLLSVILVGALRQDFGELSRAAQGTRSPSTVLGTVSTSNGSPKGALWTQDQRIRPPAAPGRPGP